MKKQPTIKNPYYLRMRTMLSNGQWSDWSTKAIGEFTDLETAQRSIRLLISSKPSKAKQIEFIHECLIKDYNGNVINEPMNFDKR